MVSLSVKPGRKKISLSEYNKNKSSRVDEYSNEQIPWETLQRQWAIKRCVLRTCSRPTSGIPAYAATDLANESVPGPNNIIFFGSWVRNSWRTFCPNPKLPFGKMNFFSVITKKIALYQYDRSSLPSSWHDLHWLLSRWYKSPPSPMPCTMYVEELGSGKQRGPNLSPPVPSPQPSEIGVRFHWVKWSVYKLTNE